MTTLASGAPIAANWDEGSVRDRVRAGDAREIELKLVLDGADAERLLASPLFARSAEEPLESIYFDTITDSLREEGLSLRVRRTGERFVQTIKAAGGASAGPFDRAEWEREVVASWPVLDDASPRIGPLLAAADRLEPVFGIAMLRRTACVDHHDSSVEISLDRGRVRASGQEREICEVELELKHGEAAALFAMAREIGRVVPVRLGVLTKSEQGYRLREVDPDKPVKAEPIALDATMSCATGFQLIAHACLRQFRLNEAIFLRTEAAGALHQMRVALRRLRSALSIFKAILEDGRFETIRSDLRWITGALAHGRNIDVLLDRIEDDAAAAPLREERGRAYAAARQALESVRQRTQMIDLVEWIATGDWLVAPVDAAACDRPLSDFAADALDRYRRRVRHHGAGLAGLDDEARHRVRIETKKLRYSAEFFAPLYGGHGSRHHCRDFLGALEDLQSELGALNDVAITPALLEQLDLAQTPLAAMLAVDPDGRGAMIERAALAHEKLVAAPRFWR
jgi:inorganic triphosphatase YgiF